MTRWHREDRFAGEGLWDYGNQIAAAGYQTETWGYGVAVPWGIFWPVFALEHHDNTMVMCVGGTLELGGSVRIHRGANTSTLLEPPQTYPKARVTLDATAGEIRSG